MTYGETIRAAREAKRMTLRALARTLGVSAPYVSDIEHDRGRHFSVENEAKVCELLDIHPAEIEASKGYTRELADWIKDNPEVIRMLRESRRTSQPIRVGGCDCPCRKHSMP